MTATMLTADDLAAMSPERQQVLVHIARSGDAGVRVSDLARQLNRERNGVNRLVLKLHDDDAVLRRVGRGRYVVDRDAIEGDVNRITEQLAARVVRELDGNEAEDAALAGNARYLPAYDVVSHAGLERGGGKAGGEAVTLYDASSGDGAPIGTYVVDAREIEGLPDGEGFVSQNTGLSMLPEFQPGDWIVCQRYTGGWAELSDGHYQIRIDGVIFFKLLQRLPGRRIAIKSTNPEFDDHIIELDELADDESADVYPVSRVWGKFQRYWT